MNKVKVTNWMTYSLSAGLALMMLTACLSQSGSESGTSVVSEPTPNVKPPLTTPERTICDPFSTGSSVARDRGVTANLVYRDIGQPRWHTAREYLDYGTIVESTLYFDRLYVPTRKYDTPFMTKTGEPVVYQGTNPSLPPQAVYEYFGLRFESQLQLAANEPAADYQMAVLSDDGAVFYWKDSATQALTPYINNDGDHSTKMKCSASTVRMESGQKRPFVLEYYQGPRFHISLIVMWRPVPDGTDPDVPVVDPECNMSGNSRYFDFNTVPSTPKSTFYELQARGWKVLENDNYYFPEQASNPCVPPEGTLTNSFFGVIDLKAREVTVTWQTSIPTYSKVEVRGLTNGQVISTNLTNTLTTNHRVTVTGLNANTLYVIKGISQSPGGQIVPTDEKGFRSPRASF
jgi:hypothetical protein